MASGFVLNAKRTVAAFAIIVALFLRLFPAAAFVVQQYERAMVQKNVELGTSLAKAVKAGDKKLETEIAAEKSEAETKLREFGESKQLASGARIDPFLHCYAAIFGIVYLLLFRRKETEKCVRKQKIFSVFHGPKS